MLDLHHLTICCSHITGRASNLKTIEFFQLFLISLQVLHFSYEQDTFQSRNFQEERITKVQDMLQEQIGCHQQISNYTDKVTSTFQEKGRATVSIGTTITRLIFATCITQQFSRCDILVCSAAQVVRHQFICQPALQTNSDEVGQKAMQIAAAKNKGKAANATLSYSTEVTGFQIMLSVHCTPMF